MKKCNKCKLELPLESFGKESRAKNGYKPRCKKCMNEYYNSKIHLYMDKKSETQKRRYYSKSEEISKKNLEYYYNNKESVLKAHSEYIKLKCKSDLYFKSLCYFRTMIRRSIRTECNLNKDVFGFDRSDLIKSLNYINLEDKHIDHKIPISWFEYGTDLKIIFSLENLRLVDSKENILKGNKYSTEVSEEYYLQVKNLIKDKFKNKVTWKRQAGVNIWTHDT
jgi:hypothetical protein